MSLVARNSFLCRDESYSNRLHFLKNHVHGMMFHNWLWWGLFSSKDSRNPSELKWEANWKKPLRLWKSSPAGKASSSSANSWTGCCNSEIKSRSWTQTSKIQIPYYLLAVWPQASYLTSLCLSFFFGKMGWSWEYLHCRFVCGLNSG